MQATVTTFPDGRGDKTCRARLDFHSLDLLVWAPDEWRPHYRPRRCLTFAAFFPHMFKPLVACLVQGRYGDPRGPAFQFRSQENDWGSSFSNTGHDTIIFTLLRFQITAIEFSATPPLRSSNRGLTSPPFGISMPPLLQLLRHLVFDKMQAFWYLGLAAVGEGWMPRLPWLYVAGHRWPS